VGIEFVADPEEQQRMLETIDEIQTMTEATIAFARGEATVEETRTVDLNALVGSLCDNLAEMRQPSSIGTTRKRPAVAAPTAYAARFAT
jgi:hypothetical protein